MKTATRSEIVEMLRVYWESRPRTELQEETAERIGAPKQLIAALLAGTRNDLGSAIPAFFGYEKPADAIYVKVRDSRA